MKIAFLTDSGSGLSIDEMASKSIFSLPLQILIDGKNYFDLEEIKPGELIAYLKENKNPKTSLPALGLTDDLFAKLKKEGFEKVIAVPICSGLSGCMNSLYICAQQNNLPIVCLDTFTTVAIQRYLIEYLKEAIGDLKIDEKLALANANEVINSCNTLIVPYDLSHLKRGGRLSSSALALANLFKIKPVLHINKDTLGKIDVLAKVRTFKRALDYVIDTIVNDIDSDKYIIYIAHVDAYGDALGIKEKLALKLNNPIEIIPLCNPVAAHCGLNSIAIQYFKRI